MKKIPLTNLSHHHKCCCNLVGVSMHFKVVVSGEKVGKIISFAFKVKCKVKGIEIKETPA